MQRACTTCGRITSTTRCTTCAPPIPNATSWSGRRDRAAQARFRRQVLARDGHQCVVCGTTQDLRACHIVPLAAGGSYHPNNGVTRCRKHDMATDRHAR